MLARSIILLKNAVIFLAAFVIVLYVLTAARINAVELTGFFFRMGDWESLIIITLIVTAISMFFISMLQWQFRSLSGKR